MSDIDIRQSAFEMLLDTLSAEDGAGSVEFRLEEGGEWAEVQGFLDMGHLVSEVVSWTREQDTREPSDDEREELANLIPLGFREQDGVRNVYDAADRILTAGFRKTTE